MKSPNNKVLHDALATWGDKTSLVHISGKSRTYWDNQCNPDQDPSHYGYFMRDLRWIHMVNPKAARIILADANSQLASWERPVHGEVTHRLVGKVAKESADVVMAATEDSPWSVSREQALEAIAILQEYINRGDHEHASDEADRSDVRPRRMATA